jgi:hypothetical protein
LLFKASGDPSSDLQQVKPVRPVIPSLPDDIRLEGIIEEAVSCDSSSRLMAHKTNCNHYYQCVNGVALERNCPPGTVFIPEVCLFVFFHKYAFITYFFFYKLFKNNRKFLNVCILKDKNEILILFPFW